MNTSTLPDSGLDFTAIDFETANRSRASVCAVGAARVRGGIIVNEYHSLVSPPPGFDDFESANIRVHGLTKADVSKAPSWDEVYPTLLRFIGEDLLVGHNVQFDVSVLLNATSMYDLPWPELKTLCTRQLSRAALQIPSYSLPWVVNHLGLGEFKHHDPLTDAKMAAHVLIALAQMRNTTSIAQLTEALTVPTTQTFVDEAEVPSSELDSSPTPLVGTGFVGQMVCFTGKLQTIIRNEAHRLVEEHGGQAQSGVNKKTTILVTGDFDSRTFRPGASFSLKLQKALDLAESGQPLEIITEEDFMARLSLTKEELRNRVSRARGFRRKLPDWVITQAGTGPTDDYWEWFRASLAHPEGRASGNEKCIWCNEPINPNAHWIHRDRHVCGMHCNERLKRAATRAWDRAGLRSPTVQAAWGHKRNTVQP